MPKTNQPPRIAVHDMTATEWVPSGPPGVEQQNIRNDPGAGRWFGGVRFAPLAARTIEDYVATAARLANNPDERHALSHKIAANKHRLYRDRTCISALEDFLDQAVRRPAAKDTGVLASLSTARA